MSFPRLIKKFKFDINDTYIVPGNRAGKLLLIAYEIFGNVRFYKPIAEANNIKLVTGCRIGIRPIEEALRLELENDGYTGDELENLIYEKMVNTRVSDVDWNNYYNTTSGYISDVTEGMLLLIPTSESAIAYLDKYETIGR